MEYTFHCRNALAPTGALMALNNLIKKAGAPPVILCIGSDLVIGDSLGPVCGTKIRSRIKGAFVYGTLSSPVTAKEVRYVGEFIKRTHPGSPIIAIDAALGAESEIGLIKISNAPLRPGAGANKRLGKVGDISIIGIVGKKTNFPYSTLNLIRLSPVYSMASTIATAVSDYLINLISEKNEAG